MKKIKNINKKDFFLNIVLPSLLAEALFVVLIFAVIIPKFNNSLIEAKKEMILEIINTSICIADKNYQDAFAGKVTFEHARQNALNTIENIRYGTDNKDYIWITDNVPNMLMHPYRKDLIGKNVDNFTDLNGKKMFAEMVDKVKNEGEGYVDYMWQWMDDSSKVVPKISYIKEYKNWNWILGTGVYIEDIRNSINRVVTSMLWISIGIFVLISFLLVLIAKQNLKVEKERKLAEDGLKESNEKYKALVEASNDGTLMFLNDVCIFRNKRISELIDGDNLKNIKPNLKGIISTDLNQDLSSLESFLNSEDDSFRIETQIYDKHSNIVNVLITISKVSLSGENGLIIIIKDLSWSNDDPNHDFSINEILSNIADSNNIGVFRAIGGRKGRITETNQIFLDILAYSSFDEISAVKLFNIFEDSIERREFISILFSNRFIKDFPCRILKKDNSIAEILVSAVLVNDENSLEHIDGIIIDNSQKKRIEEHRDELISKLISQKAIWGMPVSSLELIDIPLCSPDLSIKKALEVMSFYETDVLIAKTDNNDLQFIISKEKILNHIANSGFGLNESINFAKLIPDIIINSNTKIIDCLVETSKKNANYAIVSNFNEIKLLRLDTLKKLLYNSSEILFEKLKSTDNIHELSNIHRQLPLYISSLVKNCGDINIITSIITEVSDIITNKIITIAVSQCGQPPCRFAFIALGSEGRSEQGLSTDQDNAIIYELNDGDDKLLAEEYFLKIASIINNLLNNAGYKLCQGEIMANNPKWNQTITVWKQYFNNWISLPEPQNLIDSSIFFDFRCIYGENDLSDRLRDYIHTNISNSPSFLNQIAIMSVNYKIPVGMFGRIQTETKIDQTETFNLKNAIRLLVNIVRLYAMKYSICETNTLKRLEALYQKNHIQLNFYREISFCFRYLMNLQFQYQLKCISNGVSANNHIDLTQLTALELNNLKNVLNNISTFQSKIKYDFSLNQ